MARAVLKPEERRERDKAEAGAWTGMQQRGAELGKQAMVREAEARREAGLPPEQPGQKKGESQ